MFRKLAILNKKYKRMLALWMGPKLTVLIFNAKDAEAILKAKGTFKAEEYQFLRPWLGESILISEGKCNIFFINNLISCYECWFASITHLIKR